MTLARKIKKLIEYTAGVKAEFKVYIVNKELPLEERWKVFCEAPDSLKDTSDWIEHFKHIEGGQKFEDRLYDSVNRGEKVHIPFHFELIEEDIKYLPADEDREYSVETITALKEYFLSKNWQTINFNW